MNTCAPCYAIRIPALSYLNLTLLCLLLTPQNHQIYNSKYSSLVDLILISCKTTYTIILTLSAVSKYIYFSRKHQRSITVPMYQVYICSKFYNEFEPIPLSPYIHNMFILSDPSQYFNQQRCRNTSNYYNIRT